MFQEESHTWLLFFFYILEKGNAMKFNTFAKIAGVGVAVYLYGQACRAYGFVEGLLFSKEVVDNVFEKRKESYNKYQVSAAEL